MHTILFRYLMNECSETQNFACHFRFAKSYFGWWLLQDNPVIDITTCFGVTSTGLSG